MNPTQANKVRLKIWCNLLLVCYISSYVFLSATGHYMSYPTASGHLRFKDVGLAIRDRALWEPRGTVLTSIDFNVLGAVYSPLILIDRYCWHRNITLYPTVQ